MRTISLVSVLAVWSVSATASAQPTDGRCFPACRPGFFCVEAECVSMCNPACAPGMLCSPQGQCVSACNPACGPGTVCSPQGQCVSACNPPCGPGTLCSPQGQCVSACNPPCAPGQTCTGAGACEGPPPGPAPGGGPQVWGPGATAGGAPAAWGPGAAPANTAPALTLQPGMGTYSGVGVAAGGPGWARTAGVLGIITAVGLTALTAATVATNGEPDTSIPLGITATVFGAALIPVVALGAGSARDNPNVHGASGLRTAAWVAYALALGDALVLIGLSLADAEIDGAVTASVGVLGLLSDLGMTIDAYASASESEEQVSPMGGGIGVFITPAGVEHSGAVVGLAGSM